MPCRSLPIVTLVAVGLAGCSLPVGARGASQGRGHNRSVYKLRVGECITPPTTVRAELSSLMVVPCTAPHTQEVFAFADYRSATDAYPGSTALTTYADGACLQDFEPYVGNAYTDSSLFYTYLVPSIRSWNNLRDRNVVCIVTTTGQPLLQSVKGSKE